jgi:Ice-binding-like
MRRVVFKARFLWLVAFAVLAGAWPIVAQAADVTPSLNTAASFAVLSAAPDSGGAVTCTTSGTIIGDVGSSGPAASVVTAGCTIVGAIIAPVPAQVVLDFNTAYDQFRALPCPSGNTLTTLDGQVLLPGIWCVAAGATSTGSVLTLNGSSTDTWIFKIGTEAAGALTGTSFSVVMANGAPPPCNNVYWSVDAAVTMKDSHFVGTILAGAAITITRGTFNGNALAKAGVTVTGPGPATVVGCAAAGTGGPGTTPECLAAQTALDIAKAKDVTEDAAERARDKKEAKDKDDEDNADRDSERDSHEKNAEKREEKREDALMRSLQQAVREACSSEHDD